MMKTNLAIDLGHRHLRAVEASIERGRLAILRQVDVALPAELEGADAAARGAFVAGALRDAGIGASSAVWTVLRERVAFKRLALPTAATHELPGMVRLAMTRESTVAADAVIDFVPAPEGGVWAVAVARAEIEAIRAVAAAAKIGVERIAPRTCGTAMLLETLPGAEGDAALACLDLAGDGVELVVAGRTGLQATRGIALAQDSPEANMQEARRSWTAYRLQQPQQACAGIRVLGPESVTAPVVEVLRGETGVPVEPLRTHPDLSENMPGMPGIFSAAGPLAGLLLEPSRRRERIDLAHPRKAPDLAARRRMRAYMAIAVLGIAYAVGWTIGKADRRAVETRQRELVAKATEAAQEGRRFRRDELRAKHLDAWIASQPAWLDSMLYLSGFAPDPSKMVLDSWSGQTLESEVALAKDGTMRLSPAVRIALDAETTDRASADALREALVAKRDFIVRSTSTEGKAGRRLPVAVEIVIESADGAPVDRPASATVSQRAPAPGGGR